MKPDLGCAPSGESCVPADETGLGLVFLTQCGK